jgi:RNA polymerase sigma factor (sigma-70 family)
MGNAKSSDLLRQVRTLFGAGTVAGLSDAQLLERFRSRSASAAEDTLAAEAAFEILVARHGPMVLGVCRRALSDPAEVEDAFQATFLVLVRRAASVRVGDSLGRWLYGVSRRVAAKARARSHRARIHSLPLAVEPTARATPDEDSGLLAALDDEMNRLPEKYRAPVILCHLEGLSHAEAAARLHWPIGTVSGRLSRARGLLKDRLVRRGVTSSTGPVVTLLTIDNVRAAVPEPLAVATARAAAALACGEKPHAGAAAALTLMNETLRSAVPIKLKVAAFVILAIGATGTAAVPFGVRTSAVTHPGARSSWLSPAVASERDAVQAPAHRPADEIVKEIEALLQPVRRPVPQSEFINSRYRIAALVDELRTAYPDEPRLTRYLPERWESLTFFSKRANILAEIGTVQRIAKDPALKREALLFETCLKFWEPIDGRTAISLAESFINREPRDSRGGELLQVAKAKLEDDWFLRVGLVAILALAGVITGCTGWRPGPTARRRLKLAAGFGMLALGLLAYVFCSFQFLPYDRQSAIYGYCFEKLSSFRDPDFLRKVGFVAFSVLYIVPQQLENIAQNAWTGLAFALASATAIYLVIANRRLTATPRPWMATIRLAALGFIACLAGAITIDALLIAGMRAALAHRITLEYPGSIPERLDNGKHRQREYEARLVEGQRRQKEELGKPFALEFADAITGRPVSISSLRGRVVVVNFWATDRGPFWSAEIPELKRLYTKYHPKGVEFIGVSLDRRDEEGGLESLTTFVTREQIPWPQYHEGSDSQRAASRPAPADRLLQAVLAFEGFDSSRFAPGTAASEFALSWGANYLPSDFLIDAVGKLYSTEACGQLDTLISRLLADSVRPSKRDRELQK